MSVEELSQLHRRYVELSERFRSAWTFHQFVGSVNKILLNGEKPSYPVDFQDVYGELKEISGHLNASSTGLVREKLAAVEKELSQLSDALLEQDNRIAPAALRQFFQRVKNADEKILTQLVKFYLFSYDGGGFPPARLDKVDFLITRLAVRAADDEEPTSARKRLREVLQSLWQLVEVTRPGDEAVERSCQAIAALRKEAVAAADLDQLLDGELVARYRDLKHELGDHFFQPQVLFSIVDANLTIGRRIRTLYQHQEQRIFADYQRIFELETEAPTDDRLNRQLASFRLEVERFERRLETDEIKLDELAQIRTLARSLIPRLEQERGSRLGGEEDEGDGLEVSEAEAVTMLSPPRDPRLAAGFERIVAALEGGSLQASPQELVSTPEVFAVGLEPREVVSFRRLVAGNTQAPQREQLLLESAALRLLLLDQLGEIKGILDETLSNADAPMMAEARRSLGLADRQLRLLEHHQQQAVLEGDVEEARQLQLLKVRLMRDFAELWLRVHKPTQTARHWTARRAAGAGAG